MKRGVDHIGVTVCFYCYDDAGRLLLQKRSPHCRDEQGTWDCGGGAVEFGESFEEAAIREIYEEYCCSPLKLTFCGVNNVLRTHNNQKTHWVCLVFAAHINPKDVSIGDPKKIEDLKWFKADYLPQPLHSMYLAHLALVKNQVASLQT